VSAALSALVVKAAFYLVLRLWLDLFPGIATEGATALLGGLGALAVVWGSWLALRADRLKLLAAYSTVAQLGYLFLALPLLMTVPSGDARDALFGGVLMFALSHGFAKAALFLAAGTLLHHGGHDRIAELDGTAQRLPATTFTIALAGIALVGLPPSGTFLGKWQLLAAAVDVGAWWAVAAISAGSMLATAYVFRVLNHAFGHFSYPTRAITSAREEGPALLLALAATVALGLAGAAVWPMLEGVL
jgi:formate hydrogenlyase subunit 3/multisubunit Na+/H+ antiporter MnhD subunit